MIVLCIFFFFFFQAEDGIRDVAVTGVQTCALPIFAALESKGWSVNDVQIVFLAPSDAKIAYTQGAVDAWSTWEPYVSQEEVLFQSRRVITAEGLTAGIGFQVASSNAIRDKHAQLED